VRLYYLLEAADADRGGDAKLDRLLEWRRPDGHLFAHAYPFGLSDSAYVQAVFQGFLCRDADAGR